MKLKIHNISINRLVIIDQKKKSKQGLFFQLQLNLAAWLPADPSIIQSSDKRCNRSQLYWINK